MALNDNYFNSRLIVGKHEEGVGKQAIRALGLVARPTEQVFVDGEPFKKGDGNVAMAWQPVSGDQFGDVAKGAVGGVLGAVERVNQQGTRITPEQAQALIGAALAQGRADLEALNPAA